MLQVHLEKVFLKNVSVIKDLPWRMLQQWSKSNHRDPENKNAKRKPSDHDDSQLAKAYVESIRIPGAEFTYKPLSWAAPPYSMAKDNLPNRAAAKVLEDMLGSPPVYFRCAAGLTAQ